MEYKGWMINGSKYLNMMLWYAIAWKKTGNIRYGFNKDSDLSLEHAIKLVKIEIDKKATNDE